MIGIYRIEGGSVGMYDREAYSNFRKGIIKKLGEYCPISMSEGCIWELNRTTIILSAENAWTPRFTLIPDSEKAKADLEGKLGVKLIK